MRGGGEGPSQVYQRRQGGVAVRCRVLPETEGHVRGGVRDVLDVYRPLLL